MANQILAGAVVQAGMVIAGVDADNPPVTVSSGSSQLQVSSGPIKTIIASETPNQVYVYDSTDLTVTPTVLSAPAGSGAENSFGRGVHSDDDNIYITALQNDTSPSFYVYDINDLSATPTLVVPPPTTYSTYGTNAFAEASAMFASVGDKIYISNYETAWGRWVDPRTDRGKGVVFVYNKNDWSEAPTVLSAHDRDDTSHPTNRYFGANFGYALTIDGSNLYVTRGFGTEGAWDTGIFVYDINDLSSTPSYFAVNTTATNGLVADYFGKYMITTTDKVLASASMSDSGGVTRSGAVFVYDKSNLSATPTTITAPTPSADDRFGNVMVSSDSYVMISRYNRGTHSTNSMNGLVEVYDANTLQHVTTLTPPGVQYESDNDMQFGSAMSVEGSTLVIGARGTNVGENVDKGTAFVYDLNDLTATPTQISTPSSVAMQGYFGSDITQA